MIEKSKPLSPRPSPPKPSSVNSVTEAEIKIVYRLWERKFISAIDAMTQIGDIFKEV